MALLHIASKEQRFVITACREGVVNLGPHMHPKIVLSAVPLALSMPGWEVDDYSAVAKFLTQGVQMVADAGADFYVWPDNTAHIVLEQITADLPLPGLHIADAVCHELTKHGSRHVGLLSTRWTITGPVYETALVDLGLIANGVRLLEGGEARAEVPLSTLGEGKSPYPFLLIVEQSKHEHLLYEFIGAHGRDVRCK